LCFFGFENVWFLQGRKGPSGIFKKGEKNWNARLNARQAEKMGKDEVLVISMALVTEHKSYVELDFIESMFHIVELQGL
jgi:hypothetical protein